MGDQPFGVGRVIGGWRVEDRSVERERPRVEAGAFLLPPAYAVTLRFLWGPPWAAFGSAPDSFKPAQFIAGSLFTALGKFNWE